MGSTAVPMIPSLLDKTQAWLHLLVSVKRLGQTDVSKLKKQIVTLTQRKPQQNGFCANILTEMVAIASCQIVTQLN